MFRFEYPVMKDGKPVLDENRKQVTKGRMLDFMQTLVSGEAGEVNE